MNLPRFTAESSLARATAQYRSVRSVMQSRPETAVMPQLSFLGWRGSDWLGHLHFCPPMCADLGDGHCLCRLVGGLGP